MALPDDFNKIFGSTATGGLTPIGDVNYAKGWEFVGSNPPTKNDFSYLQNLSDLKSQWLYSNKLQRTNPFGDIKSDGTVQTALENLGLGDAAKLNVGTTAGTVAAGDDPRFNADFGEGQSWQNVKASRAAGVTYTNSSGKMIAVSISTRNGETASTATVDDIVVSAFTPNKAGTILSSVFFLVPNGSTYGISSTASLAGTDTYWVELR